MKVECELCPHHCKLDTNETGLCGARKNIEESITPINYGKITSIALDTIEKKPLKRFYPGSLILSVGSFGCNLKCPFCQNHEISMADNKCQSSYSNPENLVNTALKLIPDGNIGIAYTYNEPLIGYEFVRDCSIIARQKGLKNVVVTNGCFCEEPMKELFPYIDALNVDLKGITEGFYKNIRGDLATVKNFIRLAAENCHVEVTTLVIPGENDSEDELKQISEFIASVREDIPLHISRFFPRYNMTDRDATSIKSVYELTQIAKKSLRYVHMGNC